MGQFKLQQWVRAKVVEFDYDYLLALESGQCEYCLSDRTVQLCLSLLETAAWQTRYFSDIGTEIDKDVVENWAATALRELMPCGEAIPQPTKTYDDDGHLIFDPGNGLPPYSGDSYDPRFNSPTAPPLTGEDADCIMAGNLRQSVSDFRDNVYNLLNTAAAFFAFVAALLSFFALIISGGTAAALVIGIVATFFGLDAAAFLAAVDDDQLDTFACLFYCRIHAHDEAFTGVVTVGDYDGLLSDIDDTFSGIQVSFFRAFVILAGVAGLQNASSAGDGYGFECDECGCVTCDFDHVWDWKNNAPTTLDGWNLLTTSIVPIIGNTHFEPPPSSDGYGYTATLINVVGGYYINGGEYQSAPMIGMYYDTSADEQNCDCTLHLNINIGASFCIAIIYADTGAGLEWVANSAPESANPSDAYFNLGVGVTRVAVIINSDYTASPQVFLGHVDLAFS